MKFYVRNFLFSPVVGILSSESLHLYFLKFLNFLLKNEAASVIFYRTHFLLSYMQLPYTCTLWLMQFLFSLLIQQHEFVPAWIFFLRFCLFVYILSKLYAQCALPTEPARHPHSCLNLELKILLPLPKSVDTMKIAV